MLPKVNKSYNITKSPVIKASSTQKKVLSSSSPNKDKTGSIAASPKSIKEITKLPEITSASVQSTEATVQETAITVAQSVALVDKTSDADAPAASEDTGVVPAEDCTEAVSAEEMTEDGSVPLSTPPPHLPSGIVKLLYEQYDETFPVELGSITQAAIDEVYCLSFVMPGCSLRLSEISPTEKTRLEQEGKTCCFVDEGPAGVFHGVDVSKVYYVYVEQEADRLARDQAEMKTKLERLIARDESNKDGGEHREYYESCSCLFGNPCVDEYVCKDWNNRLAIAAKNGWKGF